MLPSSQSLVLQYKLAYFRVTSSLLLITPWGGGTHRNYKQVLKQDEHWTPAALGGVALK